MCLHFKGHLHRRHHLPKHKGQGQQNKTKMGNSAVRYLENADEKEGDEAGKAHVNHGERDGQRKVEVFRRQNPLPYPQIAILDTRIERERKREKRADLVVENDAGGEQDVDEQVDISQHQRFADHHLRSHQI